MIGNPAENLKVLRHLSPFYLDGHRFLSLEGTTIDRWIADHAVASMHNGTVKLTAPDGRVHYAHVRAANKRRGRRRNRRRCTAWVEKFNRKAGTHKR